MEKHMLLYASLAIAGWALYFLIDFYRDPLRKVPGPFFTKVSGVWLLFTEISGNRSQKIHDLHQRYGGVVRVAPKQISFSSRQAMRDIYGATNNFIKAPAYEAFGRRSTFTICDKDEHRFRQKRIAHVFGPTAIASVESIVQEQVEKLLVVLKKRVDQPVDIMQWFRIFALDVVGAIFLGKDFGGLDNESPPHIMKDLDEVFPSLWVEWQFPWLHYLLLKVPHEALHHFLMTGDQFYQYGADAFNEYIGSYGRSGDRRDLLTKLIAGTKDVEPLEDKLIINEMTNLIFAGTDTTGNTFSYLFYQMARNPTWQDRLQQELDVVDFADVPTNKTVLKLPILDALIHETMRLHPAAPASLQRIALSEGGTVDGVQVPKNTIIACQAYTTQRDPEVYPDPDKFLPGRWLEAASPEHLAAMHDHMLVWGKGQRSCLGKQLAYMELKVGTAAIMKKYRIEIGSPTTDDDMFMTDHFALIAKGGKCVLRLRER